MHMRIHTHVHTHMCTPLSCTHPHGKEHQHHMRMHAHAHMHMPHLPIRTGLHLLCCNAVAVQGPVYCDRLPHEAEELAAGRGVQMGEGQEALGQHLTGCGVHAWDVVRLSIWAAMAGGLCRLAFKEGIQAAGSAVEICLEPAASAVLARPATGDSKRLMDLEMKLHNSCSVPFGLAAVSLPGERCGGHCIGCPSSH